MIETFKEIWKFSGKEQKNVIKSVINNFLNAVFYMLQIGSIFFAIDGMLKKKAGKETIFLCFGMIVTGIIGRIVTNTFSQLQQTHVGYFMAADKRVAIGEKIKKIPMGFFDRDSLGNLIGICTTILGDVETTAPMVLVNTLSGFITSSVFIIYMLIFDWRIGLIALAGMLSFLYVASRTDKKTKDMAPLRQKANTELVADMVEYIQGMAVVKSFNLSGMDQKKADMAIENSRKGNLAMELVLTPYTILQETVLKISSAGIMAAAAILCIRESMEPGFVLMFIILSFSVFEQLQAAGSGISIMRVCSNSMMEACEVDAVKELDGNGRDITPKTHDIEFEHVEFAYDQRKILDDVSVTMKDKTTTAIVGPSGSGKSTICSLIARFWDVDRGKICIGGYDIKDYTLEALMRQISIVFQDVYLFHDTIAGNIAFGTPGATREQIMEAAKKACCHEFIMALPDGYDTMIGDGDSRLSGGEKQRLSIARAILKDAPVIILDEATANVDPENEQLLIHAIGELTKNKTIIMIAHRLKTVRDADQILVLNDGKIVQRGKHEELMKEPGIYADFVKGRKKADNWKISEQQQ